MKKTLTIAVLVLGLLFTVAWSQQSRTWEYKFEYDCSEKKANGLGTLGWELIAIQSTGPGMANNVSTYVFKRVKN